jgi:hypothetical protein
MQHALKRFEAWHQTKRGLIIFAVIELALAYLVGAHALDTGSWAQYAVAVLLLVGSIHNLIRLMRRKK